MECINKVCLLGYAGSDPVVKTFQNGNPMSSFSLATSNSWKDKTTGERKSNTEWHRVVCFSSALCALIQTYVKRGSRIYVEGTLKTREWEDAGKGKKVITEVVLDNFQSKLILLDKKDTEKTDIEGEDGAEINAIVFNPESSFIGKGGTSSFNSIDDDIPF